MKADSAPLAAQLTLVGDWREFDPTDPMHGEPAQMHEWWAQSGIVMPPSPEHSRLLLGATLIDAPPEDVDDSPIFASLLVHEHVGDIEAELDESGDIVPARRVRRRRIAWPADGVGEIDFHEVSYLVPCPGDPRFLTLVFSTPNLPYASWLEWVFDTIVGTVAWVDPTA